MTATSAPARSTAARPSLFGRGFGRLLRTEFRLFLRDAGNSFFAFAFPAVVLFGVGFAIPGMRDPIEDPGPFQGMMTIVVMLPAVLAAAMATPALTTMPVIIANYREQGVLKRLSTTPMRSQAMLVSHVVIGVVCFLIAAGLALVVAAFVFEVITPKNIGLVLLAAVLGAAAMFGIGLIIAAVSPRGSTATAIGMLLFFPMLFFAGLWTPGPVMPDLIADIASWTPLGAASQALNDAWFTTDVPLQQLLVMAGYIVVGLPVAAKLFRWS